MRRMIRNLAVLFRRGVIRWLLRDEFSDTRAAGAVNGTPATPGPGTRTVTDTGNVLSVGGGLITCALPTGIGDPRYFLDALARAAGMVGIARRFNGASRLYFGFDDGVDGVPVRNAFYQQITDLLVYPGSVTVAGAVLSTDYDLAIVLRTTGAYYFIRGGTFAAWTLLWIDSTMADATVYVGVGWRTALGTVDAIRVPDALWLPMPLAYDIFARADGALGSSEIWGPDNQIVTARVWNNRVGTTLVATTAAQASALVGGVAIATVNTGTVNAITGATLTRAGNEVGVVLRYVDADNYIRAIHDGTNCKLVKRVAAAETDVISAVVALGAGAIRVIPDGTTFMLYLNNAQVGATSTINDAVLQVGTQQGLWSSNVGNTQDRFTVFARGSNGEYAALNKWSF